MGVYEKRFARRDYRQISKVCIVEAVKANRQHYRVERMANGRLRWSGERYRAKVERAGAVIGRMAMPLAGVYGVENEEVVKDLHRQYLHSTQMFPCG